jgi:hypothetical protein
MMTPDSSDRGSDSQEQTSAVNAARCGTAYVAGLVLAPHRKQVSRFPVLNKAWVGLRVRWG